MSVCEILSVGTEILLGDILNTNSKYLSVQLAKLGNDAGIIGAALLWKNE